LPGAESRSIAAMMMRKRSTTRDRRLFVEMMSDPVAVMKRAGAIIVERT
jgi:hypothetical protein